MKEANEEDFLLRQYLLGELTEGEQEFIEERFITDRDFKERALVIEDEMVEDYLYGGLSETEEASFVRHFLSTPEQRRKVRFAAALKKYIVAGAAMHPTKSSGEVRTLGFRASELRRMPLWRTTSLLVPATLTLLFIITIGIGWLAWIQQREKDTAAFHLKLERLNRQPASGDSRWVALSPLNVRGNRDANVLQRPMDDAVVQLWLMLIKDEYQSYQVVFQKENDAEQFPIGGLQTETTPRGRAVPLRIPAEILTPGTFILKLNGVGDGDRIEEIDEYYLHVTR